MALKFNTPMLCYGENVSFEYGGNADKETYSARDQIENGVAVGMPIAVVVLTIATMYPYLRHRIPEIQAENLTLESARKNAQHATVKSQSAVGESRDSIGSQAADSMTDSPADSRDSQAGEVQDPAADK